MFTAALTLAYMILVQTVMCLGDAAGDRMPPSSGSLSPRSGRPSLFVGATSVVGSAGWFTAFTLERAAYVKTLGQVEFVLTLAPYRSSIFKERPNKDGTSRHGSPRQRRNPPPPRPLNGDAAHFRTFLAPTLTLTIVYFSQDVLSLIA